MNEDFRRLFPILEQWTYLNSASVSPPPTTTITAIDAQLRDVQMNGSLNYKKWVAAKENSRRLLAGLFNVRAEQIAFMRNTSDALSCIANGLPWNAGDNIVTFQHEFPSNIHPWRRIRDVFGVELRFAQEHGGRVDLDELINLIDADTKVVTISAVQYSSGFRADLRRIADAARKVDALFVVDVIQAAGIIPLDFERDGVDAAAGACHKWLFAPEGLGYLYLSDRARKRVEPTLVGWISVEDYEDFSRFEKDYKPAALAWETGTFASSLFYGLENSLRIFHEFGVENINRYLLELTDFLCENVDQEKYEIVSSRRAGEKSQIVCLKNRQNLTPYTVAKHLEREKVIVVPRGDRLRISPHIYNNQSDIAKLLNALP